MILKSELLVMLIIAAFEFSHNKM